MSWKERRKASATRNTDPTMTDQSGAASTDLNVIVKEFIKTGKAPGSATQPLYGDFTNMPGDLREMIETSRSINKYRKDLPPQLRELPIEQLLALKPEQLDQLLAPPVSKPETGTTTQEPK